MSNKNLIYLIVVFLVLNIFSWGIIFERLILKEKVAFLNVGQADSEIIITKAGNILIDAGSKRVVQEIQNVLPFFEKTIDIFILSHPDRDHFLGIFDILNRYKIRLVVLKDLKDTNTLFQEFLKLVKQKKILVILPLKALKISYEGNNNLLVFSTNNLKQKSTSQSSLIALYSFEGFHFLFTGDIDQYLENQLKPILKNLVSKIEVLKVAHHGSKSSSSKEFLNFIKPRFAVIETGINNYGHPHQEAIERLKEAGATIFRTDLDGSVVFTIKGNNLIYSLK
ncbi:MAG: ComEC/Rec2 family competence protein [Minisyncoccia bacterium]